MPRILLVKTSSLGDVVHNLPVATDIRRYRPDAKIDWIVEESFAAIPAMHPAVSRVMTVALRRWRRTPFDAGTRREWMAFLKMLREVEYDAVIDTQGLFKSAIIARAARAMRCYGLDWASSREPLRFLYDRTFRVSWGQHAVIRNRELAAKALGYATAADADYGIVARSRAFPWLPEHRRYAVLLHATSADPKQWPVSHWQGLIKYLFLNDIICILPWGSARERERSEVCAAVGDGAIVPPTLGLEELAALFAGAQGVFGVDTGLTHLSAALDTPTIGIYCATDPEATGVFGGARAVNLGGIGTPPSVAQAVAAWEGLLA